MKQPIMTFRGKYNFLSNFYPCKVRVEFSMGILTFPSSEHAFMFFKSPTNSAWRDTCTDFKISPSEIKRLGKKVKIESTNWDTERLHVMYEVVKAKFICNPPLRLKLFKIDEDIVEGNDWGDVFWGVDIKTGKGENHLGKILMRVRDELKLSHPLNEDI
jgi:ribA/ribD-fused uncharacterized protein